MVLFMPCCVKEVCSSLMSHIFLIALPTFLSQPRNLWFVVLFRIFLIHFLFAFFSEKELAREEVIALQDTKSRLSQHISEIEQELKRSEPIPCF